MALVLKDRVKETCTSPGTGTVTLLGASTGYSSFSTIGNANTTYYCIADQSGNNWEVGIGTYTSSGTTLSRDTVLSNSAGNTSLINFSSGTQDVFVTYPSGRSVYADGATLTATNSSVLPIASGGTNSTATATAGGVGYGTGTAHAYTTAGTSGQALVSAGASAPSFGTLGVAGGGTGQTSYTDGQLLIGNSTGNTLTKATLTAGSGMAITNGSGSITVAASTIPVANGGTGQTSYTDGQLLIGNSTGNTLSKATLTAGANVTITNGAGAITIAAASGGGGTVQTFTSSGTWTKPATGTMAHIRIWSGGGGGSRSNNFNATMGSGAGGGYVEVLCPLSYLASSVSITVGAGGTGVTSGSAAGGNGGTSSVPIASWPGKALTLSVTGGAGGVNSTYGYIGSGGSVDGGKFGGMAGYYDPCQGQQPGAGQNSATANALGVTFPFGGQGGGGGGSWFYPTVPYNGGNALEGGGGGSAGASAGGTSVFGGAGGNASNAGAFPAGGGGCGTTINQNGTNGGGGLVVISVF
jgi:hypothetical protein